MSDAVTRLLREWQSGDASAKDELWQQMYSELRRLAMYHMNDQKAGHTLQATALVNETFLKLADVDPNAAGKNEFVSLAARAMRSILIDHARAKGRDKRGAGAARVTLGEDQLVQSDNLDKVIQVDHALSKLAARDARKAEIVELKIFGGLTFDEIADVMNLSNATVRSEMRFARAWLEAEIDETP